MTDAHIVNLKSREGAALVKRITESVREKTIEECARHIETFDDYWIGYQRDRERIAAAIRALKDKP